MKVTVEQKVASTILQKEKEITIGGEVFNVAPTSTATLILISEKISMFPQIEKKTEEISVIEWTLQNAKDCSFLGDVAAILILGAKGIREIKVIEKKRFFWAEN